MQGHPFALEYPRASESEVALIEADMKANGFDEAYPITLFQGKILDGITREGCAERAGVKASYEEWLGTEEEARLFVIRSNENRRHLDKEWLAAKRRERVAEARQDGQSLRQIAEQENVSEKQIRNDLERLTAEGVRSEPKGGKTKGKDNGRTQPATRPKKPKPAPEPRRCERCTRLRVQRDDCPQCEELNKGPAPKSQAKGPSVSITEPFDVQFEKLYDALLLLLDRRKQKMGADKCFTACLNAAFECRKHYKAWVSA